jgi:predicted amidophosphoribosyltransferase
MSEGPETKLCPGCQEPMPQRRGVCPACGHMTAWFKVRLGVGCGSVLAMTIGWILLWFLARQGP